MNFDYIIRDKNTTIKIKIGARTIIISGLKISDSKKGRNKMNVLNKTNLSIMLVLILIFCSVISVYS